MNRNLMIGIGVAALAVLLLLAGSLFTVHQTQQALVLMFGQTRRVIQDPGLHVKIPFLENVEYFDARVLDFDANAEEIILGDQKRLVVDSFARFRIEDPLRFYQAVRTEATLRQRIDTILENALRNVLGEVPLFTVLSEDRGELMSSIREQASNEGERFGIEFLDVRIKRADLPAENSQAIYRRMQTEREREAKELRAQGAELAQRIRARADRERRVIIAEAAREAQITRGEGDGEAVRVFGEAFGQDPAFFEFYRAMQAYRQALGDTNTSMVLSPDSEFFRYFDRPGLGMSAAASGNAANGGAVPGPSSNAVPQDGAVEATTVTVTSGEGEAIRLDGDGADAAAGGAAAADDDPSQRLAQPDVSR